MIARNRSLRIDIWKAIAIFGVVWIHCGYLVPHEPGLLPFLSPLFLFCVPIFILYWAYFSERAMMKSTASAPRMISRTVSLVIQFLAWSFLYWILKGDFESPLFRQLSMYWSGYGWSGQYFFIVIIQMSVLFPVIRKLATMISPITNVVVTVMGLLVLSLIFEPSDMVAKIGDRLFVYWIPYAICGIHFARNPSAFPRFTWIAPVICLLLISIQINFMPGNLSVIGPYLEASIALSAFVIGSVSLSEKSPSINVSYKIPLIAEYISRRTMGLFCLNPLFVLVAEKYTYSWDPISFFGSGIITPLLSSVFVVVVCLAIVAFLNKIGLGYFVRN